MNAGRTDERRSRFRMTRATVVAMTIVTGRRGAEGASQQARVIGLRKPNSTQTVSSYPISSGA
jgi:hypothetical protein